MQRAGDFFPPSWVMGQQWNVEYYFEQKTLALDMDMPSKIAENLVPRSEVWQYQVYGKETIHDKAHVVLRVTPIDGVPEEMKGSEFQLYFEEDSQTLHGFKRKLSSAIGQPHMEYVKNPWGRQSFFTSMHEHLIFDWPTVADNQNEKHVGLGDISFKQRDAFDKSGLVFEMGNGTATTVMNWQPGKPWWVFADKLVALPDRVIHVQGKLVESKQSEDNPLAQ